MGEGNEKWKIVPLGTLAEFRNGINYSKDNFGRGIKVINVKDFQNHSIASYDDLEEINPVGIVREDSLLREGDIIFVRSNGNRELIGRSLFISGIREKITHSAFSIRVRFTYEEVSPRFYAYVFRSSLIRQVLSSQGNGTNISNLNQGILTSLKVPLPPLPTQRKIADILSAYDDLIENNMQRIAILEEMAQMLYREWFVSFRFPGYEQVRMVDSGLGPIPEGWEVKKLPKLCSKVIDGTHDSPKPLDKGYYLVTGKHIVNGFIDFSNCYCISQEEHEKIMKRSRPEQGDIIYSTIGTLGTTTLVDQNFEFSIKNVALFKPLKTIYSPYLYLHFSSPYTLQLFAQKASGTSQKFLSLEFLRNLDMVSPTDELLSRFDHLVRPILEQRSLLNKKIANLRMTRDLLLRKLISGELDVEELAKETKAGELIGVG